MADPGSKLATAISEAQSIIEAAEERARALEERAKERFAEAEQRGYEAGFERGRAEATDAAVRLLQESGAIGDQLASEAARLALAITATVIGEQVKVDPQVVKRIALKGLRESIVGATATLFVHPDDYKTVETAQDELVRAAGGAGIRIEIDENMTRGGCIVRTDFGEVDARIDTLLKGIATRLGISTDEEPS